MFEPRPCAVRAICVLHKRDHSPDLWGSDATPGLSVAPVSGRRGTSLRWQSVALCDSQTRSALQAAQAEPFGMKLPDLHAEMLHKHYPCQQSINVTAVALPARGSEAPQHLAIRCHIIQQPAREEMK